MSCRKRSCRCFTPGRAATSPARQARQFQINRLIQSVKKHRLIPALKCIAGAQGINGGICRGPTLDLPPAERGQLLDQVRELTAVQV